MPTLKAEQERLPGRRSSWRPVMCPITVANRLQAAHPPLGLGLPA